MTNMKRVSFWARENKYSARIIIALFYLWLHFTGLFLGDIIHSFNIHFTPLFYQVAIVMTLSGFILYPLKNRKHQYKNFFARQKVADFILVSATFLFIVYEEMHSTATKILFVIPCMHPRLYIQIVIQL